MKLDKHTRALFTCMWLGLILTAFLLGVHHGISALVTFVVGLGITYWMGRTATDRPWKDWRRGLADHFEEKLIDEKREHEKLEASHSIQRWDLMEQNAAREQVLIDVMDKIAPFRRLPRDY